MDNSTVFSWFVAGLGMGFCIGVISWVFTFALKSLWAFFHSVAK